MNNIAINATEALQIAAIGPCIFVVIYIFLSAKEKNIVVIPILYFLSLTLKFLLPILLFFPEFDGEIIRKIIIFNEQIDPELSFLLILQFILGKPPPYIFWSVLAVPLIGGGPYMYLSLMQEEICFANICSSPDKLVVLYRVLTASLIFALLVLSLKKMDTVIEKKDKNRKAKYWLIIMLICFNLLLLAIDLAIISGAIKLDDGLFIKTSVSVIFVYLVLSSIFRVFNKTLTITPAIDITFSPRDTKLIVEIENIICGEDKPYMNLGFNRGEMSDMLKITEQHLSRIINQHFGKSFSELMNECRVNEAKDFLKNTDYPVTVISFDVGFSSITSFNRVFKESTGVSPSKYRSDNQEK